MKQMNLALFLKGHGTHLGAWRQPNAFNNMTGLREYTLAAQMAEVAKFDLVFAADGVTGGIEPDTASRARH